MQVLPHSDMTIYLYVHLYVLSLSLSQSGFSDWSSVVIKKDITRIQTGDYQMLKSLNFLFFYSAEKLTLRRKPESSVRLSQLTHGRRRGPTLAHTYTQWSDWWKNIEVRPSWIHHTPQVCLSLICFSISLDGGAFNRGVTSVRPTLSLLGLVKRNKWLVYWDCHWSLWV